MNRRHVLGWLGGIGFLTLGGANRSLAGYLEAIAPASTDDSRERGLKLMRFLNTALSAHRAKSGRYTDLKGLQSSPVLHSFGNSPYAVSLRAGKFGELAPHYKVTISVVRDGKGYELVAKDTETGFEYRSDETGVIRSMTAEDAKAGDSPKPIQDRVEANGRRKTSPLALLTTVATFFVPGTWRLRRAPATTETASTAPVVAPEKGAAIGALNPALGA